mmetsp:Transcript_8362/g.23493  ORF Transcript_8362/g.23493 Transcript_8362/m.23493 type:complete len:91 (-) Transcript_8362:10-282(-)
MLTQVDGGMLSGSRSLGDVQLNDVCIIPFEEVEDHRGAATNETLLCRSTSAPNAATTNAHTPRASRPLHPLGRRGLSAIMGRCAFPSPAL